MTGTTSKDDDDGKDNNSKEGSIDGKDDNNNSGNSDSSGGSVSAGGGQGNVGCCSLPLVAWRLHKIGIIQICFRINLFWSKFYLACPNMPNRIYSFRIYSRFILCLFCGLNPGLHLFLVLIFINVIISNVFGILLHFINVIIIFNKRYTVLLIVYITILLFAVRYEIQFFLI